ncbi:MAG: pyruvate kinase [Spirochaetales bacterium]|nr:pyruvate kinase [Spirochaetales bacterium]
MDIRNARTKIIGTIGPATEDIGTIIALRKAGLDIIRINFSHGTHEEHAAVIDNIRKAEKHVGGPIPILGDLCGPKLRIGLLKEPFELKAGDTLTITTEDIEGAPYRVSTSYENLPQDVQPGNIILVDDGLIALSVVSTSGKDVACIVVNGGILKSKKGLNLPNVKISVPSITDKDRNDLEFGIAHGIDFFALSFVRSADDIKELKRLIRDRGKNTPVIAKIEKPEAIQHLDKIIEVSDAVMVARGDLGVEMKTEDVPVLQKRIIERCMYYNKPVITATQMLESMVKNPRPTRAEASDVANAVYDGTDVVMLSAETSVGDFPVQAVLTMDTIIDRVENGPHPSQRITDFYPPKNEEEARAENICRAASSLAEHSGASAIICITRSGRTARMISKYRPGIPIIAYTQERETVKQVTLVRGVVGELISSLGDTDSTFQLAKELAENHKLVKKGDAVVLVAGIPLLESLLVNMVKLDTI